MHNSRQPTQEQQTDNQNSSFIHGAIRSKFSSGMVSIKLSPRSVVNHFRSFASVGLFDFVCRCAHVDTIVSNTRFAYRRVVADKDRPLHVLHVLDLDDFFQMMWVDRSKRGKLA